METTVKMYLLDYSNVKTYLVALLFVLGNIILPQIVHLLPQGGVMWLPIYFFTLIGAYKYGWKVGLLTAVFSPLLNSLLFGMPMPAALPAILLKSVVLALVAGYASHRYRRISWTILAGVVFSYQIVGTLGEWVLTESFYRAVQDFRMGLPGMGLQIGGSYLVIKYFL